MTKGQPLARVVLAAGLVAAVGWALVNRQQFDAAAVESWVKGFGAWAPAVFVGIYALATVLFLPGSVFSLAGGMLFGPVWGTLYNLTGATIGATIAFIIARYVASDWVARRAGGRLGQLVSGVEAEGWRFVAFVRLVPLFPFNLLNYALGLTRIRLSHYVLASFVCMFPGGFAYTYLGYAGREAIGGGEDAIRKGLLALALLATVAFLPRLVRRLRAQRQSWIEAAELKERLDRGDDQLIIDVRGLKEFTGPLGHICDARNIAVDDLPGRIDEVTSVEGRPITIVCKTDKRSVAAAKLLRDAGLPDVSVLRGGMEKWNRDGYPVKR